MPLIKVNSTRHTAIGTLRRGIVYDLDVKDHKIKKAITPLLKGENPALEEITAKEAKKIAAEVISLVPDEDAAGLSEKEKLAKAETRVKDLEKDLAASARALEKTDEAQKILDQELAEEAKRATQADRDREEALTQAEEATQRADAAEAEVARLTAELEAAKKPATKDGEGKGAKS